MRLLASPACSGPPNSSRLDLQGQRGGDIGALRSHLASMGPFLQLLNGCELACQAPPWEKEIKGPKKRDKVRQAGAGVPRH